MLLAGQDDACVHSPLSEKLDMQAMEISDVKGIDDACLGSGMVEVLAVATPDEAGLQCGRDIDTPCRQGAHQVPVHRVLVQIEANLQRARLAPCSRSSASAARSSSARSPSISSRLAW